ncbi:MAG: LysM peptidoglycan-binding domain-containing protein [Firmicutes bacterium]|nr:LysM peptidoglycan-binding domain-containing protein [Bacillota bacterium]
MAGCKHKTAARLPAVLAAVLWVAALGFAAGQARADYLYTVRPGDTLYWIAQRTAVSLSTLRAVNGLQGAWIYPGQVLLIPSGPAYGPDAQKQGWLYSVQPGDTLFLLAQRFGVDAARIRQVNAMSGSDLWPGQRLIIPWQTNLPPQPAPPPPIPAPAPGRSGVTIAYLYVVQWQDTLYTVAARVGENASQLAALNRLSSADLIPGQVLLVDAPTTGWESLQKIQVPAGWSLADFHKLARITYAEAGGEPYVCQQAVASVILNRIRSPLFPNTLDGVLQQPWQFEAYANGWYDQATPMGFTYTAVLDALWGNDPTHGALYFYDPAHTTNAFLLSLPKALVAGNLVFAWAAGGQP